VLYTKNSLTGQNGNSNSKRRILAVDDEPDMTTILKMALERVGFSVDIFNDPVLALERYKSNQYDLVILDVKMHKMNGFELYNRLKKMDPGINVCFLTASTDVYREKLMKETHCELSKDLFLDMPLRLKEIIEEVNKRMVPLSPIFVIVAIMILSISMGP
jgi:CheY-like chemotaxis protein